MCKNISNRLSEIAPVGRRTHWREIRLPILYIFTPLSRKEGHATEVFYQRFWFLCCGGQENGTFENASFSRHFPPTSAFEGNSVPTAHALAECSDGNCCILFRMENSEGKFGSPLSIHPCSIVRSRRATSSAAFLRFSNLASRRGDPTDWQPSPNNLVYREDLSQATHVRHIAYITTCTGVELILGWKVQCIFWKLKSREARGREGKECKVESKTHRTFDPTCMYMFTIYNSNNG